MKIKFAFQHWDPELNFWLPNTVPLNYPNKGNLPTHGTQSFTTDFLMSHGDVECVVLEQALGSKYIFPIHVRDSHYFERHEQTGFDCVDPRVLDDARQDRCKIVLIFPLEGDSGHGRFSRDDEILNQWCKQHQLNSSQVYFIHGNYSVVQDNRFTRIPVNAFICWNESVDKLVKFEPIGTENLFLNYNRRAKLHRLLMLSYIISEQLFNRGLISYHGDGVKNSQQIMKDTGRTHLEQAAAVIDSMIPLELDMDLGLNNPAYKNVIQQHYTTTFLSLVSETHVAPGVRFFSEKIWKPISIGHPFMLIASPGMLEELKSQGYKTFDAWWNEDYDKETDLDQRIRMILAELKRLSMLSVTELQAIRVDMQPVLKFNQELFNKQWNELCWPRDDGAIFNAVKNIWDSF